MQNEVIVDSSDTAGCEVVTGAFSYTGKYLTRSLLASGKSVRTLTTKAPLPEFGDRVETFPYNFDNYSALVQSLGGASTLTISYWIRFPHGDMTFARAIDNTKTLFRAAQDAGVQRVIYVSIANPSLDSVLPYYQGKAQIEEALVSSGLSYAIVRPTVIFGDEDVLINNIAWIVRRFPVFALPGEGDYKIQPIYVEDMADLLLDAVKRTDNYFVDAVGPEVYTFEELVRLIAAVVGKSPAILHMPASAAHFFSQIVGRLVNDTLLTQEEVKGLMDGLLVSLNEPTGATRLSQWLGEHADTIGQTYHSELARHFR